MKKLLLFSSFLSVLGAVAQTAEAPKFEWANLLIGKPGQDQATAVVTDGSDQIYWMLTDGSTTADRDVTYAGQALYEGSPYDGTSSNKNLTILKTNAGGEKQWCVYSTFGDFAPSEGGLAVNSNGDLIFTGSVRHTEGYLDKPITIVDGTGASTAIDWTIENNRYDRMIVGSISSVGKLNWVKTYDIDTAPVPAATGTRTEFTADAITVGGVAVDNEGNIYVCGNYRTALTFPKADGTNVTLQPKNVEGWNGDSQGTVGSFYLVKLDANGYYLSNLAETGDEIAASYMLNLEWEDGKLYAYGYLKGDGQAAVTVSGVRLVPTEYVSPIVGCFNSNLEASWLKCLPGDAVGGKYALQSIGLTVADGAYWLCGMYNGKISDSANPDKFVESTQGTLREGFIIKLDASTGEWLNAANSRTEFNQNYLTGYLKVLVPETESRVYVYGYAMNATVGVFLRGYDKVSLVGDPDSSWSILTKGGVPTAITAAYTQENGAVYALARGNQEFEPLGGELLENPGGYTNVLARFDLPLSEGGSSIAEITESGSIQVLPVRGGIKIVNTSGERVVLPIYDLTGRKIHEVAVESYDEQLAHFASGIYLVSNQKILIK